MFVRSLVRNEVGGPVSVVSSIGTHQVYITDAQFSELQVFFRQQCALGNANADFYSAAMGDHGHTLLHLMHQMATDRVLTGWPLGVAFIQHIIDPLLNKAFWTSQMATLIAWSMSTVN